MKFSVVVSTHAASFEAVSFKGSVMESLTLVAEAGYDGAELAVRNAAEVDGAALAARAAELGLTIPAIGTGQMWGDEGLSLTHTDRENRLTAIERLKQHVALARELDAVVIIGLIRGVFPPPEYRAAARADLVAGLREVADFAAERGVGIAVEAINRYETAYVNSAAEGLELIDEVGSSGLGLLLDTFHMNIEEADLAASIRACSDRLFHFHVADSNRRYPGAGHIDFPLLLATLRDVGYDGFVSGEFLPIPDGETSIRRAIAYLRGAAPAH